MPPPLKIILINCLDALPAPIEEAEAYLKDQEVNQHDRHTTELVIEELVTNTIKYGYSDTQVQEISIELSLSPGSICLKIIDNANPFDPTTPPQKKVDTHSSLEKREIGGIGLLLVKKFAETFSYERIENKNKQTITIKRSKT